MNPLPIRADARRLAGALAPALLALALAGCAAPRAEAPAADADPTHVAAASPAVPVPTEVAPGVFQARLANGLTVLVKPDRRAPTAVHMLWVRTGSMDEVSGTSGLAHMLEHLMFKGTETLAPGEFSRRVAALGGQENAFTSFDYTGYYQQVPAARLDEVMALEADRFAHNRYSDEEFAKELAVVKEERRMRTDDNPRAVLSEQQRAAVFTASPYRRPVIGWMGDLDAMTADDARAFYRRWYVPANAAVVVVGDVDPRAAVALAARHYGGLAARDVPTRRPQPEPAQRGLRRIEVKAPAEQALVSLAFRVPRLESLAATPANDDALALTVLAAVLDGYSGARLDRALTQGPRRVADAANADSGLIGRGPQLFMLTGIPAAGQSPAAVEAALRAEVARVARDGVSAEELARVKTQWVASQVYDRDSVMGQAQQLGYLWIQGLPPDADDRLIERLRGVTAQQVQSVAQRYFGDDQLTVATLVPVPRGDAPARRPAGASPESAAPAAAAPVLR